MKTKINEMDSGQTFACFDVMERNLLEIIWNS